VAKNQRVINWYRIWQRLAWKGQKLMRAPLDESALEWGTTLEELERAMIYQALRRNDWNRTITASQLGVHTTTLWRKMKRLNVVTPNRAITG
jgi:transcriptional regulator with PAS, ATPase and Fis domain